MFGFLNVNKPPGPTSHDIVAGIRRQLDRDVKVGHAGTLDPLAGGVLVLCLGPAARLADYVQAFPKRYVVVVTLGAVSTTDDLEGDISATAGATAPCEKTVRQAVAGFIGEVQQVPPDHSAVHVQGRRAYEFARTGRQTHLQPRGVTVHAIDLLAYAYPHLRLEVTCGSGTYIRSLSRDIGQVIGTGGYCSHLTRTQVGPFLLTDAVAADAVDPAKHLLSPLVALGDLPRVTITDEEIRQIRLGRGIPAPHEAPKVSEPVEVALVDGGKRLIALARLHPNAGRVQPTKVLVTG